jgi:NADPH-dependent glutamate synthase beta subunit-like oxidoreductase
MSTLSGKEPKADGLEASGKATRAWDVVIIGAGPSGLAAAQWRLTRPPHLLETNRLGVFAVGDVRAGSLKRVASAVGDDSPNRHASEHARAASWGDGVAVSNEEVLTFLGKESAEILLFDLA